VGEVLRKDHVEAVANVCAEQVCLSAQVRQVEAQGERVLDGDDVVEVDRAIRLNLHEHEVFGSRHRQAMTATTPIRA
jgi:hypothetical protein